MPQRPGPWKLPVQSAAASANPAQIPRPQIPRLDPAGNPVAAPNPAPPPPPPSQPKRNADGTFVLGEQRTVLEGGNANNYPEPVSMARPPDWRHGWAGGTEVYVDVGQAKIGQPYTVILSQVAGKPPSAFTGAHGTYNGQEFVVDYLINRSNRRVPQNPPLRISAPSMGEDVATRQALAHCNKFAGGGCQIKVTVCNDAPQSSPLPPVESGEHFGRHGCWTSDFQHRIIGCQD